MKKLDVVDETHRWPTHKMLPAKFPTIRVPGRFWQWGLGRGWYVSGRKRLGVEIGGPTATWYRNGAPHEKHASRQFTLTLYVWHWRIEIGHVVASVPFSWTPLP